MRKCIRDRYLKQSVIFGMFCKVLNSKIKDSRQTWGGEY